MPLFNILLRDAFIPALSTVGFFLLNKKAYGLNADRYFAGFVVCGVMLVYVGQRYVKSFQGLLPDKDSGVYQRHAKFFAIALAAMTGFSFLIFVKLPVYYKKAILPMVAASVLYVWMPFPGGKPLRHTVLKSFIVAVTWSYATVLLPGLAGGLPAKGLLLITLARTAFILGLVLPFDKYQAAFDASKGIKTLPHLLNPGPLFLFYLSLWLIFYMLPEGFWQIVVNHKSFLCFTVQNIWLAIPMIFWKRLEVRKMWLYDLIPFAAVSNIVIVEYFAGSLCA